METANFESQNPIPDIQIPVLPSTPTPNKNIFKLLFLIFFCLFLATLLFSTYLLIKIGIKDQNSKTRVENQITENITPTLIPTIVTDETQNWKTYKNEEFSFKYPPEYNLQSENNIPFDQNKINLVVDAQNIKTVDSADGVCGGYSSDSLQSQNNAFQNAKVGDNFDTAFNMTTNHVKFSKVAINQHNIKFATGFGLCNGPSKTDNDTVGFQLHAIFFKDDNRIELSIRLTEAQFDNVKLKDQANQIDLINKGSYSGQAQQIYNNFQKIINTFKFN